MDAAMEIFEVTRSFPNEERYSMVDQMRRSSRSVCANLAEAWRKRRYKAAFVAKPSDAEAEACETQVWIEFARRCNYITQERTADLDALYERIISQIVRMIQEPEKWIIF
jgi:four helix bundle protein